MIGIGIVTHNDVIDKQEITEHTDPFALLMDLISGIDMFTKEEYVLIIRDNDSLDYRFRALNIALRKRFKHVNSLFIQSDINDLTHAWNEIIRIALDDFDCEAVVMLNQDILVTRSWEYFIQAVKRQNRDFIAPVASSSAYQELQHVPEEEYESQDLVWHITSAQGFCWGASRRALKENMFDSKNYFDPEVEWDYNEEEWEQRNNNSGGRTLLLKNTYVVHLDKGLWVKAGLRSTKRPKELYRNETLSAIQDTFKYSDYIRGKHDI